MVHRETQDVGLMSPDERCSSRTVRLCLAGESFYPVYAGPAIRFRRYLPGLLARGVDVRVFTGTPRPVKTAMSGLENDWNSLPHGELLPVESLDGVPVHRVRLPDEGGFQRSLRFTQKLAEFCLDPAFRPDVVQLLSLSFASASGLYRLRRAGISTVFTKTMVADLPDRVLKRWLLRQYRGLPLRLVDRIVVSSSVMREKVRAFGVTGSVEVIPNGVDTDRFRPPTALDEAASVRATHGIGPDDPLLLFVGPISPRKGIDLLLEAWGRLASDQPRIHLLIVGPRRDEVDPAHRGFHDKLMRILEESGAADRVHFTGLVTNVEDYMRAADLFVFTSRREGMPNVVPEAMACGLPVVTTRFIGLPREFGREGEHYIAVDFAPAEMAQAVKTLLSDEPAREALGRRAREWVQETMAVERSLDRYAALYRELAFEGEMNEAERS